MFRNYLLKIGHVIDFTMLSHAPPLPEKITVTEMLEQALAAEEFVYG